MTRCNLELAESTFGTMAFAGRFPCCTVTSASPPGLSAVQQEDVHLSFKGVCWHTVLFAGTTSNQHRISVVEYVYNVSTPPTPVST